MERSLLILFLLFGFAACKPAKVATMPATPAPVTPQPPPPGLRFLAYDGDPRKTDPDKMSFQIGWADRRQPSEFLNIGNVVPNTKFRVIHFQFKTRHNARTNQEEDASELTLIDTDTHQTFVLTLPATVDSPPVF
jgi:hypothetical protein